MVKEKEEKENNVLTLVRAGGDALDVELLHDDKQDGDGDRHQHTACTEKRKVIVDQGLLQILYRPIATVQSAETPEFRIIFAITKSVHGTMKELMMV